MNGPLPTRLFFIHELSSLPLHTKVRFLGCVAKYDIKKGRLELEHTFSLLSNDAKHRKKTTSVPVDIYHVLNTIKADEMQVGAWLNVFGYIRSERQEKEEEKKGLANDIYVQAVMISDAGAIRVAEYEQSIVDMRAINRRLQRDDF